MQSPTQKNKAASYPLLWWCILGYTSNQISQKMHNNDNNLYPQMSLHVFKHIICKHKKAQISKTITTRLYLGFLKSEPFYAYKWYA